MSNLVIPLKGKKAVPFFRNEGTLDYMIVPDKKCTVNINLGFDFEKLSRDIEYATSVAMSYQISNNLQI